MEKDCTTCALHSHPEICRNEHYNCWPTIPAHAGQWSDWREAPMDAPSSAIKHDGAKDPWDLLPFDALREVVAVLEFGSRKYEKRNWERGFLFSRPFAATFRHLVAWHHGEKVDPETGLSPLAHAICELLFLLAFTIRGTGTDDRPDYGRTTAQPHTDGLAQAKERNFLAEAFDDGTPIA